MSEATDFAALMRVPPAEAIAYMAGRELVGETFHATALWQDEHSRAFTVSRLARADLLEALQASLAQSVSGDMTRRDWIRDTGSLLQRAGWWGTIEVIDPATGQAHRTRFDHARLQLIFDVNIRQAQAAGQWQRMLRNRRTHPYARYMSMDDRRVRPEHREWHGVTLPLDDSWWSTHRPPNGYRCRCRVVSVSQREYDAGVIQSRPDAGLDQDAPMVNTPMIKRRPRVRLVDWEDPATGQMRRIPEGIDPGFDYNAGTEGRSTAFDQLIESKLSRLSPEVATAARAARVEGGLPEALPRGQRPDLAELPPVPVTDVDASTMGRALQVLQVQQAATGLVLDDAGWLLQRGAAAAAPAATAAATQAASLIGTDQATALTRLVRQAVVVERSAEGTVYRAAAVARIAGQLYRVLITITEADQRHTLTGITLDGAPLPLDAQSTAVDLTDLLRGATTLSGRAYRLE